MIRVLYWTELFWPQIGGIEIFSLQLISALQARGYEFAVVTSHSNLNLPDETEYNGVPIYRFHFRTSLRESNLKHLVAAQQELAIFKQTFKPDLVHLHFSGPSPFFHLKTASAYSSPTLITVHSMLPDISDNNSLLTQSLRSASWVNAISEKMLRYLRRQVPEISLFSSVIHNGLKMPSSQLKAVSFDPPYLLCLGRLVNVKGFDLAIAAFSELRRRFPNSRLIIAGDGPARPDLERQANALGLTDAVDFPGWIEPENVPELINKATIVLVPSRPGDSFPLVAIQAAQMARPLVAARVGGLPELIMHRQTGLLIKEENIKELVEAVTFLLENPERAVQYGQAGRKQAQELFSLEKCVNAYNVLYRKLSGN